MAEISIPWGDETLTAALPAEWTIQQVASPTVPAAPSDWPEYLARALARPEGTMPLGKLLAARRHGRIAIVVEDLSRSSPLPTILKAIFGELTHAGVPNENIEIFFALGMHPPLTAAQAAEKIGPELAGSVAWRGNPWRDSDAYVNLGTVSVADAGRVELWVDRGVASADLRILVSSVSPHLQAGFGGGYKMLVPGCAYLDTIRQLHLATVPRQPTQQVGQAGSVNAMRRLIDAGGAVIDAAAGSSFGVQYLLDTAGQVAAVAAGDVAVCQRMLAKQCAAGCGVPVQSPADVVITNAFPRDHDLWQSFKAIAHACWAVRENGVLICLSRCPGGVNMPTFSLPIGAKWARMAVRAVGANVLGCLLSRLVPGLAADVTFFVRLAMQIIQRIHVLMVSPALAEAGARMLGLPIFADPTEAFAAAEQRLGGGAKRVIVSPAGGVTYPILRPSLGTG